MNFLLEKFGPRLKLNGGGEAQSSLSLPWPRLNVFDKTAGDFGKILRKGILHIYHNIILLLFSLSVLSTLLKTLRCLMFNINRINLRFNTCSISSIFFCTLSLVGSWISQYIYSKHSLQLCYR